MHSSPTSRRPLVAGLAVTLTAALTVALGASTAAAATDADGSTPPSSTPRAERICTELDTIEDWMGSRIAEVQRRIDYFASMQDRAEAAGKAELAERIGNAIGKLEARLTRLEERAARLADWAAEHCTDDAAS